MKEILTTVGEIQSKFFEGGEENYEYYDEASNSWKELKNSPYMERNLGFPKPELALEPIVLIQLYDSIENKGYVLGLEDWVYRDDYKYDFDLEYIKCQSEEELLSTFLKLFKTLDPFIIYAWNGELFDFPYLYNRLKKFGWNNKLSNYGSVSLKQKVLDNKQIINDIKIEGHLFLDLMALYKKFVFDTVPSYSLDYIGEKETGIKKVSHNNYVKFDDFRIGKYVILGNESPEIKATKLFKCAKMLENKDLPLTSQNKLRRFIKEKSHSDFINYGVIDFVILKEIDKAQNLTDLVLTMSEEMGCLQEDILGTLKAWDCYITNTIFKDGLIAPPHSKKTNPKVVGGFVRAPLKGKHKWILSSDVASMYPLLSMVSFNMSPETFIPFENRPQELKDLSKYFNSQNEDNILAIAEEEFQNINKICEKYNVSCGINGSLFSKERQGVIPKLVQEIYNRRKSIKKQMWVEVQAILDLEAKDSPDLEKIEKINYHNERKKVFNTQQMAAKIQMNSLYGAFASANFSMYNEMIAGSITGNGRYFIKLLANKVEEKLQSLIKSSKPAIISGDTDSIFFQIEPFINKYCKDKSISEKTIWANKFYEKVIQKIVDEVIDIFSFNLNTFDKSYINAEREVIADSGILVAKKKYAMRVRDNEGKTFALDKPKIKIQGLEIIQGGTAIFSKKYLEEAIPVILDKSENEIKEWFLKVKEEFIKQPLEDIAKTIGVSKIEDENWGNVNNGRIVSIPFASKACIATNNYIKQNNLQEQFSEIEPGNKVKILYLIKPNPLKNADSLAFIDSRFAYEFKDFIDYDINFDKFFVSPLENMLSVLNIDINKITEDLDEW